VDRAEDLRQLGELIAALVDREVDGPLRALAGALRVPEPGRRPSAQRVVAALAPASGVSRPRSVPTARRGLRLVLGVAVAAALVLVVLRRPAPQPAAVAPTSTVATTTALPPAPCVASVGSALDAASCGAAASVEGAVVTVDGRRAVVGRDGDQVLVADWGCEGQLRPALLRPATGEVLVLGPVGDGGAPPVVRAERVEGATALRAVRDRGGCAALLAVTQDAAIRVT
jgi:hypothetical protein